MITEVRVPGSGWKTPHSNSGEHSESMAQSSGQGAGPHSKHSLWCWNAPETFQMQDPTILGILSFESKPRSPESVFSLCWDDSHGDEEVASVKHHFQSSLEKERFICLYTCRRNNARPSSNCFYTTLQWLKFVLIWEDFLEGCSVIFCL